MDRRRPVVAELFVPHFHRAVTAIGQFLPPELPHRTLHPAEQVDSVRDVADGDFFDGRVRIKAVPHVAADLAVQLADAVCRARNFQRQHRHAKRLVRVLRVHPAKPHDIRPRHGDGRMISLQRIIHQRRREPVVPGLDRRVRGEMAVRLCLCERVGIIFPGGHFFADQFQREKRRMAFVHVEERWFDAERAQQPHAADAQQNFLHDARGAVAAVNAQSQIAEMLLVLRQVRVEQINGSATDIDAPRLEHDDVHADFHAAFQPSAGGIQNRLDRHVLRVNRIVKFRLPVVGINRLLEITLAVKQADAVEAQPQVARGFRVVARENAEAAR